MSELFAGIAGQDQVISYLQRVHDTGNAHARLSHRRRRRKPGCDLALRFAAGLIAQGDAQVQDEVLRRVHPDLHVYTPGGTDGYLVEQIRELTRDAELAPIRAAGKVYIVQDAHRPGGGAGKRVPQDARGAAA